MRNPFDYSNLTLNELIEKISTSRFFNLPKMVAEALKKLNNNTPPYKVYSALLTQSGTNAPVATVLENTLGDISFTYNDVGVYGIISDELFTSEKTFFFCSPNDTIAQELRLYWTSTNSITIESAYSDTGVRGDAYIYQTPIEIRVYN